MRVAPPPPHPRHSLRTKLEGDGTREGVPLTRGLAGVLHPPLGFAAIHGRPHQPGCPGLAAGYPLLHLGPHLDCAAAFNPHKKQVAAADNQFPFLPSILTALVVCPGCRDQPEPAEFAIAARHSPYPVRSPEESRTRTAVSAVTQAQVHGCSSRPARLIATHTPSPCHRCLMSDW